MNFRHSDADASCSSGCSKEQWSAASRSACNFAIIDPESPPTENIGKKVGELTGGIYLQKSEKMVGKGGGVVLCLEELGGQA